VPDVPALQVHQWLPPWNRVRYTKALRRAEPPHVFYLFTLPARTLRQLTGVFARTAEPGRQLNDELGIQRYHDKGRSLEIARYVEYGYPLSDLADVDPQGVTYRDLRKPGWLATALVVNILPPGAEREGVTLRAGDAVRVRDSGRSAAQIQLPDAFSADAWDPPLRPLEVIDGQHRLWAFDELPTYSADFELPVVAFYGLDISWQAYLFWTINITPKRINPSLAFDLYPLLRTEDWLERFGGHRVYRETRSQELVEALWSQPESPWKARINMLGEPGRKRGPASQAAWVRALTATFVKPWESKRSKIGGLFGTPVGSDKTVLPWGRDQQAAFLIMIWTAVAREVLRTDEDWAMRLRKRAKDKRTLGDPAIFSDGALLATDQGIRGVLSIANDFMWVRADELELRDWRLRGSASSATDRAAVSNAVRSIEDSAAAAFWNGVASELVKFDWRTASAVSPSSSKRTEKAALRGSGGYRELRLQLLAHLSTASGLVGSTARRVQRLLKYD
jgi:DGQHR domain-containing protein